MTAHIQVKTIDRAAEVGGEEPIYYEVFARLDSSQPLTHVGSVESPNAELAKARAWYVYDEHAWQEMCIVPTSEVISLTEGEGRSKVKVV